MIALISRTPAHEAVDLPTNSPITWVLEASGGVTFDLGSVDIFSTAFGGFVVEDGAEIAGWTYTAVLSAGDTILTITLIPDAGWTLGLVEFFADVELDFLLVLSVEDPIGDNYNDSALLTFTAGEAESPVPDPEIASHCAVALERVISQYREQPNFEALLCIYADRIDLLEALLTAIRFYRGIENNTGIRLDWIGELYRLPRNGLTDAAYRPLLRACAAAVLSRGLPEDMIAILELAIEGGEHHLEQHYPATFLQWIVGDTPAMVGRTIAKLILDRARPRGVHRVLWHQDASERPLFGWDGVVDAVGWSSGTPEDGHWAEAH